ECSSSGCTCWRRRRVGWPGVDGGGSRRSPPIPRKGGRWPPANSLRVVVVPNQGLSAVMQDYLKAICNAGEWDSTPVTTSVIAGKVGVSASSASEMVRRLAALGLLTHEPY